MSNSDLPPPCASNPPWSGKGLRRLSDSLRDGEQAPANAPAYEDVLIWYDDLTAAVYGHLAAVDWSGVVGDDRTVEITSRAKTIDTLREKLQRTPEISLGYVQDLAGVRIEANMTLSEQDAVAAFVASLFNHSSDSVKDLRQDAHSGYRGVHVWLRMPGGRVEVQVRTDLQGRWANAFESLADFVGRQIRYGGAAETAVEQGTVDAMLRLSTEVLAAAEQSMNLLVALTAAAEQAARQLDEMMAQGFAVSEELAIDLQEQQRDIADRRDRAGEQLAEYDDLLVELDSQFRAMRRT